MQHVQHALSAENNPSDEIFDQAFQLLLAAASLVDIDVSRKCAIVLQLISAQNYNNSFIIAQSSYQILMRLLKSTDEPSLYCFITSAGLLLASNFM
jgi:hypothetical protein